MLSERGTAVAAGREQGEGATTELWAKAEFPGSRWKKELNCPKKGSPSRAIVL